MSRLEPDTQALDLVVCIDYEPGIPGLDVAQRIAERLKLPLINREIVSCAGLKLGLSVSQVVALEGEPNQPIRRWILAAAEGDAEIGLTGPTSPQADPLLQPRRPLMKAIREAIREAAKLPGVIAGHDAAYELNGRPDTVRVFLRADRTERVRWLTKTPGLDPEAGLKRIDQLDRTKRAYLKQMYGLPWPDITRYELALDVGGLSMDGTAEIVVEFVRITGSAITQESKRWSTS